MCLEDSRILIICIRYWMPNVCSFLFLWGSMICSTMHCPSHNLLIIVVKHSLHLELYICIVMHLTFCLKGLHTIIRVTVLLFWYSFFSQCDPQSPTQQICAVSCIDYVPAWYLTIIIMWIWLWHPITIYVHGRNYNIIYIFQCSSNAISNFDSAIWMKALTILNNWRWQILWHRWQKKVLSWFGDYETLEDLNLCATSNLTRVH